MINKAIRTLGIVMSLLLIQSIVAFMLSAITYIYELQQHQFFVVLGGISSAAALVVGLVLWGFVTINIMVNS